MTSGRLVRSAIAAFAFFATIAFATVAIAQDGNGAALRAMTYNIRLDLPSDGANAWPHRRTMVAALIRHEAPDLLGIQEVLLGQKRDLEAALPEYRFLGVGRDDGKDGGEFSPVGFRRDRFDMVDSGTIWLSDTPSMPGKGWDAAFPRIATWARLRDRRTGQLLRVVNTHFDHVGVTAKRQSAWLLSHWLRDGDWARLPTILLGDLNSTPDSEPYRLLADPGESGIRDARLTSRSPHYGPPGTFNAFKIESDAAAPIDHVFVSGQFEVVGYAVVTQHWGGRLPSDHYPVVVDLSLEDR